VRGGNEVTDTPASLFIDISSAAGISLPDSILLFYLDPTIRGIVFL